MRFKPGTLSFTVLLGILAALPPLSIDMGLPALPTITTSLNASPAAVGLTLSLFMFGYAMAQLIFGPLSDRYGRKPILFTGCVIFMLASAGCVIAPSINPLIVWRFFQGAGAGAGMTVTLAMVRDLFEGVRARSQISYINSVISIAPMIAPTIGGGLLAIANWRAIYGLLALGGLVLVIAVALGLNESIKNRNVNALKLDQLIGNYQRFVNNRVCLGYALVNTFSFGCMFSYVASSPLVMLKVLGISNTAFGLIFASTAIGIMAGSLLSGLLNARGVSSTRLMSFGLVLCATSSIALILVSVTGVGQVITLVPLLIINTFCHGLIAPNAIHNALHLIPEIAGTVAAAIGFLQMLGGALASALIAFLFDGHTVNAMSEVMASFAIAALATYSLLQSHKYQI